MRPAFVILALSAFAVARPYETPSVNARSDDFLKGLVGKVATTVSTKVKSGLSAAGAAAVDHLKAGIKDAAHAVVGEACDQAHAALAARSLDIADFEANLEFVAQETYQQMVDDHALEDSPENYAIIKDLLKAGGTALLTHSCDSAQAALASRDISEVDGEDKIFGAGGAIHNAIKAVHGHVTSLLSKLKGGKAAPAAAPAAAAATEEVPAAEPAAEVAA
ncbi:hypothetical protein EYR40_009808 [Pleurotus pulmonarius]|nr:hypothetical protein EYR38_002850 [Pleurotus pulmonarius]KAF4591205.1 hypothetical protein EYR40_009808 [Pleurotus pulmonarius]